MVSQRKKKENHKQETFRLILPQISIISNNHHHHHASLFSKHKKQLSLGSTSLFGLFLLIRWLSNSQQGVSNQYHDHRGMSPNKHLQSQSIKSNNNYEEEDDDDVDDNNIVIQGMKNNNNNDSRNKEDTTISNNLGMINNSSSTHHRTFNYIGDIDPTLPLPWPKEEQDWWTMHKKLVNDVQISDLLPTNLLINGDGIGTKSHHDHNHNHHTQQYFLPQLIFYGDSITEGWAGTSFGNRPGLHRMWISNEDERIRQLFQNSFGVKSSWGERALKQPLILGISGSRTSDLLWRIENGEFPTSQLLIHVVDDDMLEKNNNHTDNNNNLFLLHRLERIYIVLIGTNNLGGGMLPAPTIQGMDTVGRTLLRRHSHAFGTTNTPAAIVFSELLPRRDDHRARIMCPPRCENSTNLEPYPSFLPAIDEVNRALPRVVDGWRKDFPNSRIVLLSSSRENETDENGVSPRNNIVGYGDDGQYRHTINCGKEMFSFDDSNDFDKYMPDQLHPNFEGYELWARCLKKGLDAVMMDSTRQHQ